ncbi:MAG: hypothetical protein E6R08_05290 [Nevskiaceae bacterium]|nr:MAG: hypothetical protein E6R08_05290 [Nevskiaceae bacterium]
MRLRTTWLGQSLALSTALCAVMSCHSASQRAQSSADPSSGQQHPTMAMPMSVQTDLDQYIHDTLESQDVRRIGRFIAAVEPSELSNDLHPTRRKASAKQELEPIEALFQAGEELFETELAVVYGYGHEWTPQGPKMHRVHRGAKGGPDSFSCRSCHHRGGDDGAGEYNENALVAGDGVSVRSALERNPPPLQGAGLLQILGSEVTAILQNYISGPPPSEPTNIPLIVQDVDFGSVTRMPDGSIDTKDLRSIDPDLIVKPFGWKGTHSSLRRFAEEAFQVHHGMESSVLGWHRRFFGPQPMFASQATRDIMAAFSDGDPLDLDRDGVRGELSESMLTAISVYLALLPIPTIEPPRAPDLLTAYRQGQAAFHSVGCASCHKPMWILSSPTWTEQSEAQNSATRVTLDLRKDIRNGPPLRNRDAEIQGYPVLLFSDLRRHDMGSELSDPPPKTAKPSIAPSYFLTRPLWGLADSAPYLHDGRAVTVADAIKFHGGEAAESRRKYLALPVETQRALQVFLMSLSRASLPEVSQ